jgi:hypothetical protein
MKPGKTYEVDLTSTFLKVDTFVEAVKSLVVAQKAIDNAIVKMRSLVIREKPKRASGARSKVRGSSTRRQS